MNTKNHIAKTYIQLVRNGHLDLSVKEITSAANVSRQTFYYYYSDLTDLIEYILRYILTDLINKAILKNNIKEGLKVFLEYTNIFYKQFITIIDSNRWHKMEMCIDDSLRHYLIYIYPQLDELKIKFISHASTSLFIEYANQECYHEQIINLILHSLEN